MKWIGDMSRAHDSITGALLTRIGAGGVIGYVSDIPDKNLTAENLADLLQHGLAVGLVFEDNTGDMRLGAVGGQRHGRLAYSEAHGIGYDVTNCVIFAADDENTGPADWPTVLAYMDAFAAQVPHPGYYGDQDSIDWLHARRPHWFYWQANATGWGTGHSLNAHLLQRYGDSRAAGLELDVNDIQREGVPFMGTDGFTDADRATLNGIASQLVSPAGLLARIGVNLAKQSAMNLTAEHADLVAQIGTLQQALTALDAHEGQELADVILQRLQQANTGGAATPDQIAHAVTGAVATWLEQALQNVPR